MTAHADIRHLAESGQAIPAADVLLLLDEMQLLQAVANRHCTELAMEKLEADRRRLRADALAEAAAWDGAA